LATFESSAYTKTRLSARKPLRILLVEDSEDDAELILLELRRSGFAPSSQRVETPQALSDALQKPWDIILTDHNLPTLDSSGVIALLREVAVSAPCIIVSGEIGEETAVSLIQRGASDYVSKNNLSRLGMAIDRALHEREMARAHDAAEQALRRAYDELEQRVRQRTAELQAVVEKLNESEQRFRAIFNSQLGAIFTTDAKGIIREINPAAATLYGYGNTPLVGQGIWHLLEDQSAYQDLLVIAEQGSSWFSLGKRMKIRRVDGTVFWGEVLGAVLKNDREATLGYVWMIRDLSELQRAEQKAADANRRVANSREEERLRLARDIHDGPLQDLVGVSFHMADLERKVLNDALKDSDIAEKIRGFRESVTGSIKQLRGVINDLRPAGLDEFGLIAALEGYVANFRRAREDTLLVSLNVSGNWDSLPDQISLGIFRIVQEALSNVAKHAKASRVDVSLDKDGQQLNLQVRDDGVGFAVPDDFRDLTEDRHFGLVGIAERIELMRGRLVVHSTPGAGTEIRVTVPVANNGDGDLKAP
jgi:two-component system sensor histidine kinase UhpB